ncbi:MAG: DUF2244 domain-containing protein [Pseudomonadota bacterium]
MPYQWTDKPDARVLELHPHQSMTPVGFVGFMGVTVGLIAVPLLSVVGTPVLWGLLPFFAMVIGGLWLAINRNQRDNCLSETLTIRADEVELVRKEPRRVDQRWTANPYWVSVHLHLGDTPVEKYLTLKGNGREVELGAFLSPDEREALQGDVTDALARTRRAE